MNKSLRASSIALALAVCTVSGIALAGAKSPAAVVIVPATGGGYGSVTGNISTAASSTDTVEYIGCEISSAMGEGNSSASSVGVLCYARNSAGTYVSCSTGYSGAMAAVGSINANSNIKFAWYPNGTCEEVTVSNGSQY